MTQVTDSSEGPRPDEGSVTALTAGVRAGDPASFTDFYERWFDPMYAMARRYSGRDESFCLDIVQEAMLRVINRLPVLHDEAMLASWLQRTVERCTIDQWRREQRRGRRERWHATSKTILPQGPPDEVSAVLSRLTAEEADLLVSRYGRGWSLARIGAGLGLTGSAVDGRLTRLIGRLRKAVNGDHAPRR